MRTPLSPYQSLILVLLCFLSAPVFAALSGSMSTAQVTVGSSVGFSAAINSDNATGNVTFKVVSLNGNPVSIPLCTAALLEDNPDDDQTPTNASCAAVPITFAGQLVIQADYTGGLGPQSNVVGMLEVLKAIPFLSIDSLSPSLIHRGETITMQISVNGYQASGNLSVYVMGGGVFEVTVVNGLATVALLVPKDSTVPYPMVYVNYSGDANNFPGSTMRYLTVSNALPSLRIEGVEQTAIDSAINDGLDYTVIVANGISLSGVVTFTLDGKPVPGCENLAIASGHAQCHVASIRSGGDHTIAALYQGSDYTDPISASLLVKVEKKGANFLVDTLWVEVIPPNELKINKLVLDLEGRPEFSWLLQNQYAPLSIRIGEQGCELRFQVDPDRPNSLSSDKECRFKTPLHGNDVFRFSYPGDEVIAPLESKSLIANIFMLPESGFYTAVTKYAPYNPITDYAFADFYIHDFLFQGKVMVRDRFESILYRSWESSAVGVRARLAVFSYQYTDSPDPEFKYQPAWSITEGTTAFHRMPRTFDYTSTLLLPDYVWQTGTLGSVLGEPFAAQTLRQSRIGYGVNVSVDVQDRSILIDGLKLKRYQPQNRSSIASGLPRNYVLGPAYAAWNQNFNPGHFPSTGFYQDPTQLGPTMAVEVRDGNMIAIFLGGEKLGYSRSGPFLIGSWHVIEGAVGTNGFTGYWEKPTAREGLRYRDGTSDFVVATEQVPFENTWNFLDETSFTFRTHELPTNTMPFTVSKDHLMKRIRANTTNP